MVLQLQTMVLYWAALGFETFRSLACLKHFWLYIFWKDYIHPRIYRNIQKKTLNIRRYKCYLSSSSLLLNTCFSDKAKKNGNFNGCYKNSRKPITVLSHHQEQIFVTFALSHISGGVLSILFMSTWFSLYFAVRCFGSPWSLNLDFGRSTLIFESIRPDWRSGRRISSKLVYRVKTKNHNFSNLIWLGPANLPKRNHCTFGYRCSGHHCDIFWMLWSSPRKPLSFSHRKLYCEKQIPLV